MQNAVNEEKEFSRLLSARIAQDISVDSASSPFFDTHVDLVDFLSLDFTGDVLEREREEATHLLINKERTGGVPSKWLAGISAVDCFIPNVHDHASKQVGKRGRTH